MKKILLLVSAMLFVSGCAGPPLNETNSPEDVVRKGITNLVGVPSYSFDLALDGDFDALNVDRMVKFQIDGNVSGQIDARNSEDPKLSMSLTGTGFVDEGEVQTLSADMKLNQSSLYFKLSSLPPLGDEIPQKLLDQFLNKWWEIPIPDGTYTKDNPMFSFSAADKDEAVKQKKILGKYNFFTDLKFEGMELVKGGDSYKYSARLNKDDLRAYTIESRIAAEVPIQPDELVEFDNMLNSMNFTGYVYIGKKTESLNKISGALYVKDVSNELVKEGNFNLVYTMWDFGKSIRLDIPTDAEPFNPFMLLGAGLTEEADLSEPVAE